MRKGTAAAGSSLFFALAPGIVAGAMPWWLTHWRVRHLPAYGAPLRAVGVILLAAGAVVLVRAFARFVAEGVGTPAPIAPTRHLVVGGLYSYVRNPMNANKVQARLGAACRAARGAKAVIAVAPVWRCLLDLSPESPIVLSGC